MSTPSTPRTSRRSRWLSILLVVLLCALGVGLVTFISVISYGVVTGEEFSPDTFQSRDYVFYQVPLLGIQVTPVFYTASTSDLASHLLAQGWVVASRRQQPRWHFVYRSHGPRIIARGDAQIMVNYLEQRDGEFSLLWKDWCDDHPQLAKLLWPTVAELAREELYMFVPELLHCARQATDPQEFQKDKNACLARQYEFLAATHSSLGEREEAIACYNKALQYDPQSRAAQRGLTEAGGSLERPE